MPQLKLTVNGVDHTLDVPANRYLAQVLRYDPVPGGYDGCLPLGPEERIWSL